MQVCLWKLWGSRKNLCRREEKRCALKVWTPNLRRIDCNGWQIRSKRKKMKQILEFKTFSSNKTNWSKSAQITSKKHFLSNKEKKLRIENEWCAETIRTIRVQVQNLLSNLVIFQIRAIKRRSKRKGRSLRESKVGQTFARESHSWEIILLFHRHQIPNGNQLEVPFQLSRRMQTNYPNEGSRLHRKCQRLISWNRISLNYPIEVQRIRRSLKPLRMRINPIQSSKKL